MQFEFHYLMDGKAKSMRVKGPDSDYGDLCEIVESSGFVVIPRSREKSNQLDVAAFLPKQAAELGLEVQQ